MDHAFSANVTISVTWRGQNFLCIYGHWPVLLFEQSCAKVIEFVSCILWLTIFFLCFVKQLFWAMFMSCILCFNKNQYLKIAYILFF